MPAKISTNQLGVCDCDCISHCTYIHVQVATSRYDYFYYTYYPIIYYVLPGYCSPSQKKKQISIARRII